MVLINTLGITKKRQILRDLIKIRGDDDCSDLIFPDEPIEQFDFPKQFSTEVKGLPNDETGTLIQQSLVNGRFVVL